MKRVIVLGLPLSLLTIVIGTSWAQEPSAKPTFHKPLLQPIEALQSTLATKQLAQATEPIGQQIRYSGPFTNTTVDLRGNVVIDLVLEANNRISGYINFTNYPNVPSLCGAGDFTGYRQGRNLQFSFVSNDPEPDCGGYDRAWSFTVTATLSEDYQTLENGTYQVDTGQGGVFQAVAEDLPVAQTLSTPSTASTASVILDIQDEIDRNSSVLPSDGSRYNEHTFQGQAGQEVTIAMQSRELDTYLILLDPSGNSIAQNDDISSTNTNSEITVTLPQSGTYTVVANAYDSRGRGDYSLVVQRLSSESPAIATTPLEPSQSVPQPSSTSPDSSQSNSPDSLETSSSTQQTSLSANNSRERNTSFSRDVFAQLISDNCQGATEINYQSQTLTAPNGEPSVSFNVIVRRIGQNDSHTSRERGNCQAYGRFDTPVVRIQTDSEILQPPRFNNLDAFVHFEPISFSPDYRYVVVEIVSSQGLETWTVHSIFDVQNNYQDTDLRVCPRSDFGSVYVGFISSTEILFRCSRSQRRGVATSFDIFDLQTMSIREVSGNNSSNANSYGQVTTPSRIVQVQQFPSQ